MLGSLIRGSGETFPASSAHAQPEILRIFEEAHWSNPEWNCVKSVGLSRIILHKTKYEMYIFNHEKPSRSPMQWHFRCSPAISGPILKSIRNSNRSHKISRAKWRHTNMWKKTYSGKSYDVSFNILVRLCGRNAHTVELPVIWNALMFMWCHFDMSNSSHYSSFMCRWYKGLAILAFYSLINKTSYRLIVYNCWGICQSSLQHWAAWHRDMGDC